MAKEKSSRRYNIMDLLAFAAVCIGGVALLLASILGNWGFSVVLQRIANAIGWAVLCILSTKYITTRKKIWLWVIWTVAVVMIVVGTILPLFNLE